MTTTVSVEDCRMLLRNLVLDFDRQNERSALVLLSLLALRPGDSWHDATAVSLRTVEIMAWIREHYDIDYKPNTRETIRRQTLHQFIQAHLVIENPDDPSRPINSPNWCYQVTDEALKLIQSRGALSRRHPGRLRLDLPGGWTTASEWVRNTFCPALIDSCQVCCPNLRH